MPLDLPADVPTAATGWAAELWWRVKHLFVLKTVGTSVWTALFFVAYFHLLQHPPRPPIVMPLTALDRMIPFQPASIAAYLSLWVYVGVAPGLQRGLAELLAYGVWAGALCLVGLACFYLWPTVVPPLAQDLSGYAGFAMLKGVDATGNACPSMHVAIAIFSAFRADDVFRSVGAPRWLRGLNFVWFAAIAWSTLATRQHVVIDVLAGAALGLVFVPMSRRWRPRRATGAILFRPTKRSP
jgi:hypothetical protein